MNRIETIESWHTHFNEEDFGGKLSTPSFGLTRSKATDGYFEHYPGRHRKSKIVISQRLFDYEEAFLGTLIHEMIHQYQFEILKENCNHDCIFTSIARKLEKKYDIQIR